MTPSIYQPSQCSTTTPTFSPPLLPVSSIKRAGRHRLLTDSPTHFLLCSLFNALFFPFPFGVLLAQCVSLAINVSLTALLRQVRSWTLDQMFKKSERSVGFSLDSNIHAKPTVSRTSDIHFGDQEEDRGRRGFSSRLLNSARLSAIRFFRKTSRALDFISGSRRQPPSKVSSSMTPQRFAAPEETHLSEAIEDCIKFLNSSSRRSC